MMTRLLLFYLLVGNILSNYSHLSVSAAQQQQHNNNNKADEIVIESFQDAAVQHTWKEMNDPVMGGKSTGNFTIRLPNKDGGGVAVFQGDVVNVPFLRAPGFIQARTVDRNRFPDISTCQAFQLTVRPWTNYTGYRFSFGNAHPPHGKMFAYGYKTTLPVITTTANHDFVNVILPFDEFSDYWDDATGDAIVTCHQDASYCPTAAALQNLQKVAIWAEGVIGKVHLEIRSISAVGCSS